MQETCESARERAGRRRPPRLSLYAGAAGLALVALPAATGCGRPPGTGTAAGAEPPRPAAGAVRFVDVTEAAGIRYAWSIPGPRPLNILQTIGNGCAFLDYDRDGNLDLLLVGPKTALYKGDGHGKFTDVSKEAGFDSVTGRLFGCAVGDVDGDGYPDLYLSGFRTGLLLHNEQGKRYRDVTAASGLKPQPWGTSCGFFESVPGSGRLDLYVANYAVFGPDVQPQLCDEHGIQTSCGPRHYTPLQGVLFLNDGKGRFKAAGGEAVIGKVWGRGLGVAFADFDGSGRPGIAVANDEMPGDLFRPEVAASAGKPPRFKSVGDVSGTAYDRDGNVHGGMGADWGDYDNDGKPDLFVATFQNETKALYHNDGGGLFTDAGIPSGVGSPSAPFVAFGCKFLDVDNDGWLDLAVANGHVQDNIQKIYSSSTYRQAAQLFRNLGTSPATFEDVSEKAGPDLRRPIVGRGLATGDYDNDGRVDLLIVDAEGRPMLLHNEAPSPRQWLGVRLEGTAANRDGYGAVITVKAGGRTLVRQCQTAGSYLSASDPRVHLGLGAAARVDSLTVTWPGGHTDTYTDLPAGRYVTIKQRGGGGAVSAPSSP